MVPENSCGRVVYAHIRDARRQHGVMVCERHILWGDQQIARYGYQPVHVLARGTTAMTREWTSGCEAPKGWKAGTA